MLIFLFCYAKMYYYELLRQIDIMYPLSTNIAKKQTLEHIYVYIYEKCLFSNTHELNIIFW